MVKETGEVKEKIVVRELLSELGRVTRNLSTAGGMRHLTQYSFSVARAVLRRGRRKGSSSQYGKKEKKPNES